MEQVSQALSRAKVDESIVAPNVSDIEREVGTEQILAILLFELEKVNRMFNANEKLKLTHEQMADMAIMILEEFPHESLETFALAFRRGITGRYDEKLLRLDVQVIFRWIRCFLDEQSQRREVMQKESKQEEMKPYTPEEKAKINEIIANSWVGGAIEEQERDEKAYKKFKLEYVKKQVLANKPKPQENVQDRTGEPE